MKVFISSELDELVLHAQSSSRLRRHQNIHKDFDEPCQRLFNAIEPGSYIRPHRHLSVSRDELLVAIRGLMALMTFDDDGRVKRVVHFGAEKYGPELAVGVEVEPETWHTVIALKPGSILLEVKAGPFDPDQPKDLANWAPSENSADVEAYMYLLNQFIRDRT
jgi:cupin fold WbuC family metalloprotein